MHMQSELVALCVVTLNVCVCMSVHQGELEGAHMAHLERVRSR